MQQKRKPPHGCALVITKGAAATPACLSSPTIRACETWSELGCAVSEQSTPGSKDSSGEKDSQIPIYNFYPDYRL